MITLNKSDIFCIVLIASACAQPLLFERKGDHAPKDQPSEEAQNLSLKATGNQDALLIRELSYEK